MTNRHAPAQDGATDFDHTNAVLPDLVVRTRRSDHQLQGETVYRVGRDPKSDIVMTDSRVSWRHGVLRIDGDGWILEDLGSTNGTFLGPERLDRVEISADCVVRLGNPDDGPVLRCVPQAPAVAAGPEVDPRRDAAPRRDTESWWQPPPAAGHVSPPGGVASRPPAAPREPAPAPPVPQAGPAGQPDHLPSVDCRPTARMSLPAKAMRIGRVPDNDLVLSDLNVSRHHAELRKSPAGSYEIVDLGSHNGTFVNGQRVTAQMLSSRTSSASGTPPSGSRTASSGSSSTMARSPSPPRTWW